MNRDHWTEPRILQFSNFKERRVRGLRCVSFCRTEQGTCLVLAAVAGSPGDECG
jgi:hypothetical protein